MLAWAIATAAHADCPHTATLDELTEAIAAAEAAYSALDLRGFERAVERGRAALPCVGEVVPPSVVASLHRAEGLSAFAASDQDRAARAFGAARRIEPGYRFPEALVPEENPVLATYGLFDLSATTTVEVPPPPDGSLRIDGQPRTARVPELPQTLQWLDPGGAPRLTTYLWPGAPLPAWPAPVQPARTDRRRNLALGAALGVALSGGLYGAAAAVHADWQDPTTPVGDLAGLRTLNNGLVLSSGLALGAAVGLGTAALATPAAR